MKRGSTHFLRVVIFLMGCAALALCVFAFPAIARGMEREFPTVAYLKYFVFLGYAAAVPFFIALQQGLKLLHYIDTHKAFSPLSIAALGKIKYCATVITLLLFCAMPFWYGIAEVDDAPGVIIVGVVIACAPLVIAVFAALLQKLLQNAVEIKLENELTV